MHTRGTKQNIYKHFSKTKSLYILYLSSPFDDEIEKKYKIETPK
jgi:hypothetical protein